MNELKTQNILDRLNKVCKSTAFANSGRNIRLLKFLVQKALNGEFVKEHVVGFELFEKDYNPNDRNSKVRVYMYKLRQKLEDYYQEEGKHDTLKFEIKKGQYNLQFIENSDSKKLKFAWLKIAIPTILLLSIATYGLLKLNKAPNFWDSFFNSKNETICFISDHYIVSKKVNNIGFFTHILHVDDESDLRAYQESTKDTSYQAANFSYLSKMAPMATHSLTKHFQKNNKDFSLELESDFSYDDLKSKNLIFIGQFSTLHQSEPLFLNNSKVFIRKKGSFHYRVGDENIKYFNSVITDNSTDYAMVSYQKMENGNSVLFFSSNHDIGVISTVRNFTDKVWLKEFYKQFPENAESFNALFKVTGFKRTELDCTLEKIEFLD